MRTKSTNQRLLYVVATAVVAACGISGPRETVRTLIVHHHGMECGGEALLMCLLVRSPGDSLLVAMSVPDGFEPEWGVEQEIRIVETPIVNPPADGSSIARRLDQTLRRTVQPAGTEFQVRLTGGLHRVRPLEAGRFTIYDIAEMRCPASQRCAELDVLMTNRGRANFTLRHEEPGEPMTLLAWEAL